MAKKQSEEKNTLQQAEEPVVKNGKFVCSDGQEYSDGYFASEHQKMLNKQLNK